mgnify:CR=1 FL=1
MINYDGGGGGGTQKEKEKETFCKHNITKQYNINLQEPY